MKLYGRVKNGKLISSLNEKSLKIFDGQEVEIRIRVRSNNRSNEQNSLYWKWVDILSNDLGYTKTEMHELIKYKFLKREYKNKDGETNVVIKSTSTLTIKEFNDFMNDILYWSNNTLEISLPEARQFLLGCR
tara:strand:+ start:2205 stop:2600 length:396 start_codon:yes stop_codon:yes gene_type:complete